MKTTKTMTDGKTSQVNTARRRIAMYLSNIEVDERTQGDLWELINNLVRVEIKENGKAIRFAEIVRKLTQIKEEMDLDHISEEVDKSIQLEELDNN